MRILLFALAMSAATAGMGTRAHAQNYPWCTVLNMGDAAYNCGFVSREQCLATVSGLGGLRGQHAIPASLHCHAPGAPAAPALGL